jgi:hypothetical protein
LVALQALRALEALYASYAIARKTKNTDMGIHVFDGLSSRCDNTDNDTFQCRSIDKLCEVRTLESEVVTVRNVVVRRMVNIDVGNYRTARNETGCGVCPSLVIVMIQRRIEAGITASGLTNNLEVLDGKFVVAEIFVLAKAVVEVHRVSGRRTRNDKQLKSNCTEPLLAGLKVLVETQSRNVIRQDFAVRSRANAIVIDTCTRDAQTNLTRIH